MPEADLADLNIKKKRVMTYFIEATEKLIREDGVDGVSIRKIASEAGYNSATLYNYFEDLEHLVLFASVRYLRDYVARLEKALYGKKMNALEQYRTVYEVFSDVCFTNPEIFHNMFFGKYRDKLNEVISQYYALFPADLGKHSGPILSMLTQGDIYQRDLAFMPTLVSEGYVAKERMQATTSLIIRTHQSFIYDAWMLGDQLDKENMVAAFLELFDYTMAAAR